MLRNGATIQSQSTNRGSAPERTVPPRESEHLRDRVHLRRSQNLYKTLDRKESLPVAATRFRNEGTRHLRGIPEAGVAEGWLRVHQAMTDSPTLTAPHGWVGACHGWQTAVKLATAC